MSNQQLQPEIKTIRGREYRLYPFGHDEWWKLSAELAAVSGPGAAVFLSLRGGQAADVSGALVELAKGLGKKLESGILGRVCAHLSWNAGDERDDWRSLRKEKARDAIWSGRYLDGVLVLAWVLGVAYAGFIQDAGSLEDELSTLLGLDELFPTESTDEEP